MTAVTTDQLQSARRAAIEDSGWGRTVKLVQPRNFTFWVAVVLLVAGFFNMYAEVGPALAAFTTSLAQGTVYFTLFGALLLWIILQVDRYSRIPGKVVVATIVLGGTVSTFAMAKFYNDAFLAILAKTQGSAFVNDWGPGLTAPLSEEIAKQVPLILMIGLAPRVVRSAFDGFVIGMLGGLAFQIFEDVTYVYHGVEGAFGNESAAFLVMFLRTVLGFTGHWMWSGVVGAGIVYLIGRPAEPARRGLGIALIVAPMVLHGLWDAVGALGNGGAISYGYNLVLGIFTLVVFVWTYRHTVARERQWMRDILAPEVGLGVISDGELEAAVGRRKDRRRFIKAEKGLKAERNMRHVLDATHELADELAVDPDGTSPRVGHARAEIVRLRG